MTTPRILAAAQTQKDSRTDNRSSQVRAPSLPPARRLLSCFTARLPPPGALAARAGGGASRFAEWQEQEAVESVRAEASHRGARMSRGSSPG